MRAPSKHTACHRISIFLLFVAAQERRPETLIVSAARVNERSQVSALGECWECGVWHFHISRAFLFAFLRWYNTYRVATFSVVHDTFIFSSVFACVMLSQSTHNFVPVHLPLVLRWPRRRPKPKIYALHQINPIPNLFLRFANSYLIYSRRYAWLNLIIIILSKKIQANYCAIPFPFAVVKQVEGERLVLQQVLRTDMGGYLCIASNGVPPTISKRYEVQVNCK